MKSQLQPRRWEQMGGTAKEKYTRNRTGVGRAVRCTMLMIAFWMASVRMIKSKRNTHATHFEILWHPPGTFFEKSNGQESLSLNDYISNNIKMASTRNFPEKLYALVEEASNSDHHSIISWTRDGISFEIHDIRSFLLIISPRYFSLSKYRSLVSHRD